MKVLCVMLLLCCSFVVKAEHIVGKLLQNDLVDEQGKAKKIDLSKKKYIVLYYSASWCGPCQKFTPQLVKFYDASKKENFELVFISSDKNKKEMLAYMTSKKMKFPALKYDKVMDNKDLEKYKSSSIPQIVVIDQTGKAVINENAFTGFEKLKALVK